MQQVVQEFGGLNILVNNGAVQYPQDSFMDITPEQFKDTFETNIFGMFFLSQAAVPYLSDNDTIIYDGVAPGPIYLRSTPATSLWRTTRTRTKVEKHQWVDVDNQLNLRQHVFLATNADSSYITGQIIHVNGGDYITT